MTSRFGRCVMLYVRFITPNDTWFFHHLFRSGTSSVSTRGGWLCSLWPLHKWRRSTATWLSLWGMGVRCLDPTARVPLLPRQRGDCNCGAHRLSLPTQEAHLSATSGPAESILLAHSSSEELDVMELRQMWLVSPPPRRHPHMRTYCYVMTCAIVKLNLNWSVEKQESAPGRLDEHFLLKISQHSGQAFAQYGTVNLEAVSRSPTQGTWLHT